MNEDYNNLLIDNNQLKELNEELNLKIIKLEQDNLKLKMEIITLKQKELTNKKIRCIYNC
jgi:hypothetical protein